MELFDSSDESGDQSSSDDNNDLLTSTNGTHDMDRSSSWTVVSNVVTQQHYYMEYNNINIYGMSILFTIVSDSNIRKYFVEHRLQVYLSFDKLIFDVLMYQFIGSYSTQLLNVIHHIVGNFWKATMRKAIEQNLNTRNLSLLL